MSEFLKRRPWIWIVALLGLFVLLDAIFLYVASSTQGDDVRSTAPAPSSAPSEQPLRSP